MIHDTLEDLRPRWLALWQRLGDADRHRRSAQFDELMARYLESHRAYHDVRHLVECLQRFEVVSEHLAGDPLTLELAIWYHDAIYDPQADDNEARSAELAQAAVAALDPERAEGVAALILATADHDPHDLTDGEYLMDIDLAILGDDEMRYAEYEAAIRREYDWVPLDRYCQARSEVLRGFLDRPQIFRTELFREASEEQARKNLNWALNQLNALAAS